MAVIGASLEFLEFAAETFGETEQAKSLPKYPLTTPVASAQSPESRAALRWKVSRIANESDSSVHKSVEKR